jgi:hypothetical protein
MGVGLRNEGTDSLPNNAALWDHLLERVKNSADEALWSAMEHAIK